MLRFGRIFSFLFVAMFIFIAFGCGRDDRVDSGSGEIGTIKLVWNPIPGLMWPDIRSIMERLQEPIALESMLEMSRPMP